MNVEDVKMSQQILLLDISSANARSKGQALRHAEPKRTPQDRKVRRNELRREKSKATLPVTPIIKRLVRLDESSLEPLEKMARPFAYDRGTLSMVGSQFEADQVQKTPARSIEWDNDPQHLSNVSSDSFDICSISHTENTSELQPMFGNIEEENEVINLFRQNLSGSKIDIAIVDASRVALAMRLGSNSVHWQHVYQGLFPYRPVPNTGQSSFVLSH